MSTTKLLSTFLLFIVWGFAANVNEVLAQIPTENLRVHLSAGSGITEVEGTITSWADQSGNGFNAVNGEGTASRPQLVTNVINGEPVVRFNTGTYLGLSGSESVGIVNSDYEIFVVVRSTTVNTSTEYILSHSVYSGENELFLNGSVGATFIPKSGAGSATFGMIGDYSDTNPHLYQLQVTDTFSRLTVDGADTDEITGDGRTSSDNTSGGLLLGTKTGNNTGLNGDIAEVIIYNAALSETEQDSVENYLVNKYGITVPVALPTIQTSNLSGSEITRTSLKLSFTSGDGAKRIVIAKERSAVDAVPSDFTTYTANAEFGSGTEIGTGNYVVYSGDGSEVSLSGLTAGFTYHFYVVEYNGNAGEERYLTTDPARTSIQTELPPGISTVSPSANSNNVSPNSTISVTYMEPMNTASVVDTSFIVRGKQSGRIEGSFSFPSGDTIAVFTPDNPLKKGDQISVNSTSKVRSALDENFAQFSYRFNVAPDEENGTFSLNNIYDAVNRINDISLTDINQDGNIDLVIANGSDSFSTHLGLGDGTFGNRVNYSAEDDLDGITTADLNNDGYPDVAGYDERNNEIIIFINNGDGTFGNEIAYLMDGFRDPSSIEADDIDGDGHIDLVVRARAPNIPNAAASYGLLVYINKGNGTFNPPINNASDRLEDLKIADMNNDGLKDVLGKVQFENIIHLYTGGFAGTFTQTQTITPDEAIEGLVVKDINGDGNLDLITTNRSSRNLSVILGNGDGTFSPKTDIPLIDNGPNNGPRNIEAADLNGDGFIDLMVTFSNEDEFSILLGNGDGTFSDEVKYLISTEFTGEDFIASGDLNNDGRMDIITEYGSEKIAVFLSQDNEPAIRSVSAAYQNESSFNVKTTINPMNLDTEFRVKYGYTKGVYSDSTAWQQISAAYHDQTDSVTVNGVALDSTIFFTLEARNSVGDSLIAEQRYFHNKINTETALWLKPDLEAFDVENGKITQWYDVSGNRNHAIQETAANQPAYSDTSMNNIGAVRFDGSSSYLALPNQEILGLIRSDVEVFIVYSSNSTSNQFLYYNYLFNSLRLDLNVNGYGLRTVTGSFSYPVSAGATGDYTSGQTFIINTSGTDNDTYVTVNADSVGYVSGANGQPTYLGANPLYLGTNTPTSSLKFNGDIAEFIIYKKKLSTQERADVYEYLALKYGIEGDNLPTENSVTLTGTEGWRLMANPYTQTTFKDLFGTIWTQGFPGAKSPDFGSPNVFTWDTASTGNDATNWKALENIDEPFDFGTGALVYVFSDDNYDEPGDAGFPKTLTISGVEPLSSQDLSNNLNPNQDGWTLLGNPFRYDIRWDAFAKDSLSNSVYVWDPDTTSGGWKTYNGSIGDLTDGEIGAFNGFFVQTLGENPALTIPDSARTFDTGSFRGKQQRAEQQIAFSVKAEHSSGVTNTTWFQFSDHAAYGMDSSDAYKLAPLSASYVSLGSVLEDQQILDINHLPLGEESYSFPLHFESTQSGEFTFSVEALQTLPEGWSWSLEDHETDVIASLDEPYSFTLQASKAKEKSKSISPEELRAPQNLATPMKAKLEDNPRFTLTITAGQTEGNEPGSNLPQTVELQQNYPNPFNPSTVISYQLPQTGNVRLDVYDMIGRRVATLVNSQVQAGVHEVNFNASNLSSGIYIYRLQTANQTITKKLTLIK